MAFRLQCFSVAQWTELDAVHILETHAVSSRDAMHIPHRATIITLSYNLLECWPLQCFDIIRAVQTPFPTQFIERLHAVLNTFEDITVF